jgi:DNA-binding winged helix-turn-helix (wHTH) protein
MVQTNVWDVDQRTLMTPIGAVVNFTYREAALFNAFWTKYPAYVEGGPLLREVWGNYVYESYIESPRTSDLVRSNIYKINKKLRGSGLSIQLRAPSRGWRIVIDERLT